jgi:hypothetical protein
LQHDGEVAEIGLYRAQQLPKLGGTLFEARVLKPICKLLSIASSVWVGDHHALLALHCSTSDESRTDFGVQAFQRQEHNREVGGVGRLDILARDAPGFHAHGVHQRLAGVLGLLGVARSLASARLA